MLGDEGLRRFVREPCRLLAATLADLGREAVLLTGIVWVATDMTVRASSTPKWT